MQKSYPHQQQRNDLRSAAKGSPDAFSRFYEQTVGALFAYVHFHTGDRQEAEDVVSEAFLRLVDNLDRVSRRSNGSPKAWLFTVARNILVDKYRKAGGNYPINIDQAETVAAAALTPEQSAIRSENIAGVLQQLQSLSVRQQEVLSLRYFGDLRNREIAALLEIDERTVSSQITRGLQTIRAQMTKEATSS